MFKNEEKRRICIRVLLQTVASLSKSKLSMTGLNSLARLLIRNLRVKKLNLSLRGTSLASNSITLIGVDIRYPIATLIARNFSLSNLMKIDLVL